MFSFICGFIACWLIGCIAMMLSVHNNVVKSKFQIQKDEFPYVMLAIMFWPIVIYRSY
jgi:hypothetical protein